MGTNSDYAKIPSPARAINPLQLQLDSLVAVAFVTWEGLDNRIHYIDAAQFMCCEQPFL